MLAKAAAAPVADARRLPVGRVIAIAVAPFALAAAVLLYITRGPAPTLPGYDATWNAGDVAQRGDDAAAAPEVLPLSPGGRFELVLRPATPIEGAVIAHAFLLQGSQVRPWAAPMDTSVDGTVRIVGPVGKLFEGTQGEWTIAIVVGRPEAVPSDGSVVARAVASGNAGGAGWRLFTRRVTLLPPR